MWGCVIETRGPLKRGGGYFGFPRQIQQRSLQQGFRFISQIRQSDFSYTPCTVYDILMINFILLLYTVYTFGFHSVTQQRHRRKTLPTNGNPEASRCANLMLGRPRQVLTGVGCTVQNPSGWERGELQIESDRSFRKERERRLMKFHFHFPLTPEK